MSLYCSSQSTQSSNKIKHAITNAGDTHYQFLWYLSLIKQANKPPKWGKCESIIIEKPTMNGNDLIFNSFTLIIHGKSIDILTNKKLFPLSTCSIFLSGNKKDIKIDRNTFSNDYFLNFLHSFFMILFSTLE